MYLLISYSLLFTYLSSNLVFLIGKVSISNSSSSLLGITFNPSETISHTPFKYSAGNVLIFIPRFFFS